MSCPDVSPCGGSAVGTWTVMSSCLRVTGSLNIAGFGLGCTSVSVTGSLQVSGSWTGNGDGTYADNTTTSGTEQITIPAACLFVSGTTTTCDRIGGPLQALGYTSIDCVDAAGGGCNCTATVQQTGSAGLLSSDPQTSGNFTTPNNVVTTDSGAKYSYCVAGEKMTWTPQTTSPTTMGTIVFQGGGTIGGMGGATGSGGHEGGTGGMGQGGGTGAGGRLGTGGGAMGGRSGTGGGNGAGGSTVGPVQGPCDIYATGNTPCVAAYSTVRVLSSKYTGFLYQVRKGSSATNTGSGGTTQDIGVIAGGFADSAAQDAFCMGSVCTVSKLYDQSGKGNDLVVGKKGCYPGTASEDDYESSATRRSLMISGHKVYALYMNAHEGYRNNTGAGMPTGTGAQGVYEIADGKRVGPACCWDFGNASKENCYGPTGSMNAIYFGTGYWGKGMGNGPWFLGDFEAGVWATGSGPSNAVNNNLPSSTMDYAFGILKTSTNGNTPQYAIRVGNAQSGNLTTAYDGQAPATWQGKGGIILGIGGDNSNSSFGTFFEGAVTAGRPSDATDAAVLANVQAAKYGQ